jgi:Xaa-Pro dipeptidase
MGIALEPKLGIPGFGMVGLENTFEVTASGGRSLTGDATTMLCLQG